MSSATKSQLSRDEQVFHAPTQVGACHCQGSVMIRFDKVSKVYSGGHQALQKVSFHLRKGEMAFLTGHSGAGKSTLLKLISVMERPTDGRVFFHGDDVSHIQRSQIPYVRRQIGMIFQDHRLLMDRTVFDNVALPRVIVNRKAELANCVIDSGVIIPEGLVVGQDPEEDAKWFRRTETGIVLITQDMLDARARKLS